MLRVKELEAETKKIWMWTNENSFREYFNISPRSCRIERPRTTFPHIIEKLKENDYRLFKWTKLDLGQQKFEYIFVYHKEVEVEFVNLIELLGSNEIDIDADE